MKKWEKVLIIIALLLVGFWLWIMIAGAEDKKYQPTEVQHLRLQVKQDAILLAQKDLFIAQQNLQATMKSLNDEAARVKVENNWPEGLVFNQQKLSFTEEPPASAPPGGIN